MRFRRKSKRRNAEAKAAAELDAYYDAAGQRGDEILGGKTRCLQG